MHVIFDGSDVRLDNFNQTGAGFSFFEGTPPYQHGYGYFAGIQRYRGNGLGDIFRSIWRVLKPMMLNAGHTAAPIAKSVGSALAK
jgi:hypothetical protein